MNRHHRESLSPSSRHDIGKVLRTTTAAALLVVATVGLPWLFVVVAGSPVPGRLPHWDEIYSTLSHRDDGTLLLGAVKYAAWALWAVWTGLVLLEVGAQLRGRPAPRIPGLDGPQRLAAMLVTSLGATVIGTTMSVGRVAALPSVTMSVSTAEPSAVSVGVAAEPAQHTAELASTATGHERTDIRFAFSSAELSRSATAEVVQAAHEIRAHADPASPVAVVGHTDSVGPAAYNQHLSLRRADVVRKALARALGTGYRFHVSGKGETEPIAVETRADGSADPLAQARNRRVEISYTRTLDRTSRTPNGSTGPTRTGAPSSATPAPPRTAVPAPSPPRAVTVVPSASTAPSDAAGSSERHTSSAVTLPSGATVGLSFAFGVGAALAASHLQRRRRRRTPSTGPDPDVREPRPAAAVRRLRQADLAARAEDRTDQAQRTDPGNVRTFPVASNGKVVLGIRDDDEVTAPISGLVAGLVGPGATAAGRAYLLALLTHAGEHDIEVVVPMNDVLTLTDATPEHIQETARHVRALRVTDDLDAALRVLESERIHRARLLDTTEAERLEDVRSADPAEPLPRIVLIASAGEQYERRLTALSAAADVYDMATVTLGPHPAGTTVTVDGNGLASAEDAPPWDGLRLCQVAAEEARQILQVIRSAHGAPETEAGHAEAPVSPPPAQPKDVERPVNLRVLGPPRLLVGDTELATGIREKARELLTYLAVHADGASRGVILAALWPDVDQKHAVMRFHAAVNDIRTGLRRATSLADGSFVIAQADRYRLDPDLIDVDLWRFRAALYRAVEEHDQAARVACLQEAADAYEAHLATEADYEQPYEWIEPEREALRRQIVETLTHLAELRERDEPERSMLALERARTLDRYGEEIYQRIMTLQACMGRPDAVRRTYRLLETVLEELGVDPGEESQQLLSRLTRALKQRVERTQ